MVTNELFPVRTIPWMLATSLVALACYWPAHADDPFATRVVEYSPAPGQFVNVAEFNDPSNALGPPSGAGTFEADNSSVVSLGGFGGSITLAFDHTVEDHRANPLGLDAIVFGNAYFVANHVNRHWAECGHIEISLDVNRNGLADDPWYLVPGSHILDATQFTSQTWDADTSDAAYPPSNPAWIPPEFTGSKETWSSWAYRLPSAPFDAPVLTNPLGLNSESEGVFGYADFAPTLMLGDWDADNTIEDPTAAADQFYTVPDNPFTVGIDPGTGGGDAFDITWAVDPETWQPADLPGFDFIRITNAVNHIAGALGESSTEIDAVADARPGLLGDADADRDVDSFDYDVFEHCVRLSRSGSLLTECRVMDFDDDGAVALIDFAGFQHAFNEQP